jgi:hypothetical protein
MVNINYIAMGGRNENKLYPLIKELYGGDLVKIEGRFAPFDYESPSHKIELKSRDLKYNKYPTTMVGYNKIELAKLESPTKKVVFLFAFLDGLYEWEYNDENFEAIGGMEAVKSRTGYVKYNNTNFNPNKPHLYIPIEKLVKKSDLGGYSLNECLVN